MKDNTNKALKLGVFVAVAILLFVVAVWLIGSKNNYFNPSITIHTSFRDIRGLIEGNNVRFAGINVCSVKKISLVSDSAVMLDLTVSKDYAKFIYRNSVAEIGQEGLVGNKMVTISSGTPESGLIENGSYLKARKSIDYDKMLQESQDILTLIRDAASDLKSVAKKIDEGKGDLGKLVNENTITTEINSSISKLNSALTNIDGISKKINNGEGDLGKLVNNNDITTSAQEILSGLKQTAQKADSTVGDLQKATESINTGKGTINRLLNDSITSYKIDTALFKFNNTLDQFNKTARAIQDSWLIRLFTKKKASEKTRTDTLQTIRR